MADNLGIRVKVQVSHPRGNGTPIPSPSNAGIASTMSTIGPKSDTFSTKLLLFSTIPSHLQWLMGPVCLVVFQRFAKSILIWNHPMMAPSSTECLSVSNLHPVDLWWTQHIWCLIKRQNKSLPRLATAPLHGGPGTGWKRDIPKEPSSASWIASNRTPLIMHMTLRMILLQWPWPPCLLATTKTKCLTKLKKNFEVTYLTMTKTIYIIMGKL